MDMLKFKEDWADFYKAIHFMVEGKLEPAEDILRPIIYQEPDWYVLANYGRILESMRSFSRALEQFEFAAAKLILETPQKYKSAANVQIHIARCFYALKQPSDARRALLSALEFDPDNLTAQLELDKSIY